MSRTELNTLLMALQDAAVSIGIDYFALPVAGRAQPVSRERVYCYEMYHQLRLNLPQDYRYTLNAEIDKAGRPWVAINVPARKPDMVVHKPGGRPNLGVIEVKAGSATADEVKTALESLEYFTREPFSYEFGILWIFGGRHDDVIRCLQRLRPHISQLPRDNILFLHHPEAGTMPKEISRRDIAAA